MADVEYEVVVVGAGPVGLSAACALSDKYQLLIIDQHPIACHFDQVYDTRVFAINPRSERFLKNIGAWGNIISQRVMPYRSMYVWDGEGIGEIEFHSRDIGEPHLGHIIEGRVLKQALIDQAKKKDNITFMGSCELKECYVGVDTHVLITSDHRQIKTKLLIGADGANSWIRDTLGIEVKKKVTEHTAIVCTVETSLPHQHCAYQVFLKNGPLAFLPLPDQHVCSIVWSTSSEDVDAYMNLSDEKFCQTLGLAFENRLGEIQSVGQRGYFPIYQRQATQYVKPGFALVGDAAHTIHPLAGQGLNLGFSDAQSLSEKLNAQGLDSHSALRAYHRERRADSEMMQLMMSGFKQLFESNNPALQLGRNAGLNLMNGIPVLKEQVLEMMSH